MAAQDYISPEDDCIVNLPRICIEMYEIFKWNKSVNSELFYLWHLRKKMSKQQLGDRPPGDNNYFHLEDKELRRAGSGGRSPNATAWHPERMELRRIVDRLHPGR